MDVLQVLSAEDTEQIVRLIEALNRSSFDFLQLEVGDVRLTLGKGDRLPGEGAAPPGSARPGTAEASMPTQTQAPPPTTAARTADDAPVESATPADDAAPGQQTITSPLAGVIFLQPQPGSPPFVQIGSEVEKDTTVGLIEVMKVYTGVPAGLAGVVTEICVEDGQFIEYGQPLFRVRAR